jgi:hypothetical protein
MGVNGGRPERKAHNLTAIYEPYCLENVGPSTSHNHVGLHGLLHEYNFIFIVIYKGKVFPSTGLGGP